MENRSKVNGVRLQHQDEVYYPELFGFVNGLYELIQSPESNKLKKDSNFTEYFYESKIMNLGYKIKTFEHKNHFILSFVYGSDEETFERHMVLKHNPKISLMFRQYFVGVLNRLTKKIPLLS